MLEPWRSNLRSLREHHGRGIFLDGVGCPTRRRSCRAWRRCFDPGGRLGPRTRCRHWGKKMNDEESLRTHLRGTRHQLQVRDGQARLRILRNIDHLRRLRMDRGL